MVKTRVLRLFVRRFVVIWAGLSTGCASIVASTTQDAAPDSLHVDAVLVDAVLADASSDTPRPDAGPSRCTGPLRGWAEVDMLLGGDYERLVAADAAGASALWLVGGGRTRRNEPARLLRVEIATGIPRVAETIAVPGTESWEPLALATDGMDFILAARGPTGEALLARIERGGRTTASTSVEALRKDLMYRLEADVALRDGDVVLAMRRLGVDRFVIERRDAALALRWSEALTPSSFRLRPDGTRLRTNASLYALEATGLRRMSGAVAVWGTIGATRGAWVGVGNKGFELERDDGSTVRGAWPGSTFSGWGYLPAFESTTGVFIAGNVDFAPVLGWFQAGALTWIQVPRSGGAGVPYGEASAVGMFLLGIEIPRPEQPLRYWGCRR